MQHTITRIIERLRPVEGVGAIVLGGSRARGTEHEHSDVDIGIYYDGNAGLDVNGIRLVAAALDDERREDVVTEIGGWGPWINGGGWLRVDGLPVDLLFRDLLQVSQAIDQCLEGDIAIHYQPGHPHGFANAVYAAEAALCRPLWDPNDTIGNLKAKLLPYPQAMRVGVIGKFLWEADFSLAGARKGMHKQDLSYIAGHCFRAVSCINQTLFAHNDSFWMNEKGAVAIADTFSSAPQAYARRVDKVFGFITEEKSNLDKALSELETIIEETKALVNGGGEQP